MKMTMKVGAQFSNNNQKIQPLTLWREGAIYTPSPRPDFPKLPPSNSFTAGFGVKLQGWRCTNPTFSRIQVYKSDLLTYSRFTRMPAPGEGSHFLRGAPGVTVMKVQSTSDQPSPSFPKSIPLPEGHGLRTCASEQPFVTFGRTKAISFATEGIGL